MDARFEQFLSEKKLFLVEKLGKGRSSHVFLVKNNSGKKLVAKIERPESTRFRMFVPGPWFSEWLFENPSKAVLQKFVKELERQARALDKIKLDHGQLAGMGRNILVRKDLPVIIDFEKASDNRKCHNLSKIDSFLFKSPYGAIAKRVRVILEVKV